MLTYHLMEGEQTRITDDGRIQYPFRGLKRPFGENAPIQGFVPQRDPLGSGAHGEFMISDDVSDPFG